MLDVRRLVVLREVATQGSFSAAAQALTYSQSAVSQQIATLEREAGARLVQRQGRGIRLTDAGQALVRRADAILTELAAAETDLRLIAGLRGGQVRVSTFASAATSLLPAAVTAFRAAHPGVRVELSLVEETSEAVEGLRAGRADLALLAEPLDQPVSGPVETHRLLDDPMLAVLPAGHRLARRRTVRLDDLAAEPWVLGGGPGCSDRAIILRACHAAGFEPRVSVEFPTDDYNATQGDGGGRRRDHAPAPPRPGGPPRSPGRAPAGRRRPQPAGGRGRPPRRPGPGDPGDAGGDRRRRPAAQRLVKALSPVISRPTIRLWMASVPS
jgi:molybdate transport repressor ModE-like protein